jgi:hypothetical protein
VARRGRGVGGGGAQLPEDPAFPAPLPHRIRPVPQLCLLIEGEVKGTVEYVHAHGRVSVSSAFFFVGWRWV